jgi:hypothetical protein
VFQDKAITYLRQYAEVNTQQILKKLKRMRAHAFTADFSLVGANSGVLLAFEKQAKTIKEFTFHKS